jgi:glycosyltransferase involved in cell wall biosynthesis
VNRRSSELGVHYLGALAYPGDVAKFLRSIDVLVVPSVTTAATADQSPRVVIEAMLSGCTVIGSTCGAIPGMLGEAGRVVAENSPKVLAKAIRDTCDSAPVGVNLDARERAMREYSHESVAEKLRGIWKRASNGGQAP